MKSFGDRNFQVAISKKNLHRSESSGDFLS
nr:MAG TPA: coat protein [Caudoviricetes sp.]